MSAKLNISIGIGTLATMLIMTMSVLYFTNQGLQQSERNNIDIQEVKQNQKDFEEKWTERVRIGNTNTNNTQDYIKEGIDLIIENITAGFKDLHNHRLVTNATFKDIQKVLNSTDSLTSDEYAKLADNRVDSIVGNITEDHNILFKALNISRTDNTTDTEEKVEELVRKFLENQTN